MTNQDPTPTPPKGPGWIDRLAQRSSGLEDPRSPENDQNRSDDKELSTGWKFAGLGLQFAGTVGLFWFIGQAIDRRMHWDLAATLTCVSLAVIGSMYLLIKEAVKANQDHDQK